MKVSIIEDDVLLRQNLKLLLSGETGISVVSVYSTAEEALAGIKRTRPEILLTDIGLPGMSGIELIREL